MSRWEISQNVLLVVWPCYGYVKVSSGNRLSNARTLVFIQHLQRSPTYLVKSGFFSPKKKTRPLIEEKHSICGLVFASPCFARKTPLYLFRMISSKVGILTHLRTEHIIKSIPADRVTLRLSKHMLIVKITCFIVEIFALKADVLREISTKKQEIWDFDGSQPKFWWISNKRYKLQQWIFSKPYVQKIWNKLLQIENCQYFWKMLS